MKVSLVLVTYRSAAHLALCLDSFQRQAAACGVSGEVVVVEQSEDPAEAAAVHSAAAAATVLVRPNRGYAAGLNCGAGAASGDVLLLANPDIEFLEGSLAALLAALGQGFDLAGPQLVWDPCGPLLLPVPEDPSPGAVTWQHLRRRWQGVWRLGVQGQLDRTWQLWQATGPRSVPCLRGPLLALDRECWQRLGPLDEGYFLYFEETEWLWRAWQRGFRLALVGDSRVVHRWGHATCQRSDCQEITRRSERRFMLRNYSAVKRWLVTGAAAGAGLAGVSADAVAGPCAVPRLAADLWLLSPFAHLQPAAGWLGSSGPTPSRLTELTAHRGWYLAAAARKRGRWQVRGAWSWGF